MTIIRCRLAEDGRLVPTAVEFEHGDVIHFESDEPVRLRGEDFTKVEVVHAFALSELSAHLDDGVLEIGPVTKRKVWDKDKNPSGPPPVPPHKSHVTVVVTSNGKKPQKGTAEAAGGGE